jgi:DNA polymerase III epsilon subunit-like protein
MNSFLARNIFQRKDIKDMKLSSALDYYNIVKDPTKLHDAMYDIELTAELFSKMYNVEIIGRDIEIKNELTDKQI